MDGVDILLRFIGAFYMFAGFVASRTALTSNILDQALAAITLKKTDRVETHRTAWLLSLASIVFTGGACLMLLLEPAAWIFALGTIVQALYFLVLGPYYFDVADPPDPLGRKRSINAFVIYGASTLFVAWAAYTGRLIPFGSATPLQLGLAAVAIVLFVGHAVRHLYFPRKRQTGFGSFDDGDDESSSDAFDESGLDMTGLPASSKRIKVMADYRMYPLWAMDDGLIGDFAPQDLGVSDDLNVDLWTWANEFDASLNPDDPATSLWSSERYTQHVEQGLALARRIKRELPDREVFAKDTNGDLVEITAEQAN